MLHTNYIYQINQKQTNYHQFQSQLNFINIWCYILPTFNKSIKSIRSKQIIINFNLNQISSIFDVTYFLHLTNQSNQWKTTNNHQFQSQSNFINIWCYILPTFNKSIKSIRSKQIIINFNINQISKIFDDTYSLHLLNQSKQPNHH
jgi:K+-sensing histidine kinase KdpD